MTKILALTFAAAMAGLSLSLPSAIPAESAGVSTVASSSAPEVDSTPASAESSRTKGVGHLFVYNSNRRDPFVPLVIPTPIPAAELVAMFQAATETNEETDDANTEEVVAGPPPTPTPVLLPKGIRLECILWSPQRQVAIIDGSFCYVGTVYRDVTIKTINEMNVEVVYQGKDFQLAMPNAIDELRHAAQSTVRMENVN